MTSAATLRTQRFLPHPPEALFQAFAQPERLALWWGPAGFRNTFDLFEFHPGGRWEFVMHGPDGRDHPNRAQFQVLEADRIVIRHVNAPHFTLTVHLQPVDGGTQLEWLQAFDDPQVADAVRAICEPANEENLDRLAVLLSAAASDPPGA